MIKIEHVHKNFGREVVLKDVSIEVAEHEFVVLVGESGSGKSTLLRIVAGLEKANRGEVIIGAERVKGINPNSSMVFQSAALLPWLTARQNVEFPYRISGQLIDREEIDKAMAETGLTTMADKYPRDLSGGQRQRVGIARALVLKRPILLLDEPFSALDIKTATELRRELLELWQTKNLTIVMVSHLVEEAIELADRVVVLKHGILKNKIHIDLPRPRQTESKEFLQIVDQVKLIIEQ